MELRHLRYFVAVAEELHFGRAAARLHIAQPPLSQQIRQLEEELDVLLFQRTKRRVELTEAGRAFLVEARRTLAQSEQAVLAAQRAHRGETGRLTIGFVGTAAYQMLPQILRRFRSDFPDVTLTLREMPTHRLQDALDSGEIDVALLRSDVRNKRFHSETLLQEPLVVALAKTHPLAVEKEGVTIQSLAEEPFVMFPREVNTQLYDQIMTLCQQAEFCPQIVQEAIHLQTVLGLVGVGLGVSILPGSIRVVSRADVIYQPLKDVDVTIALCMAWPDGRGTAVCQNFLQTARMVTRLAATDSEHIKIPDYH